MLNMPIDEIYDFAQQRHNELLREAVKSRLIQQAKQRDGKRWSYYRRSMVWLGHRLVAWGYSLHQRYAAATAAKPLLFCREMASSDAYPLQRSDNPVAIAAGGAQACSPKTV